VIDPDFWRGRRVLITGHTGFKGSWLTLWLHSLGAQVRGLAARPARESSLFAFARVDELVTSNVADICDYEQVERAVAESEAEVVMHLAARAILNESVENPLPTYATNVLGTANLLEAVRRAPHDVRAVVCVTSDKCYANQNWDWGYRESDELGGTDPYSSSKACQELVVAAYRSSLLKDGPEVATARAGNVIGGGDWGRDRLVPDVMRAALAAEPVEIRNPASVRAWQHVLDPLGGYLTLAQRLATDGAAFAGAWNFAPGPEDARSVQWLVDRMRACWPAALDVRVSAPPRESVEQHRITLDASKARERLGWRPTWSAARSVDAALAWYAAYGQSEDMRAVTLSQIEDFQRDSGRGDGAAHAVEP